VTVKADIINGRDWEYEQDNKQPIRCEAQLTGRQTGRENV